MERNDIMTQKDSGVACGVVGAGEVYKDTQAGLFEQRIH